MSAMRKTLAKAGTFDPMELVWGYAPSSYVSTLRIDVAGTEVRCTLTPYKSQRSRIRPPEIIAEASMGFAWTRRHAPTPDQRNNLNRIDRALYLTDIRAPTSIVSC